MCRTASSLVPETSDRWAVITFKAKLKPHADPNRQKTETNTVTSIIYECKEKRRQRITWLNRNQSYPKLASIDEWGKRCLGQTNELGVIRREGPQEQNVSVKAETEDKVSDHGCHDTTMSRFHFWQHREHFHPNLQKPTGHFYKKSS